MTHFADLEVMSFENDLDSARVKLRRAEDALDFYLHGNQYKYELHIQLASDAKTARDEVIAILSRLCPKQL